MYHSYYVAKRIIMSWKMAVTLSGWFFILFRVRICEKINHVCQSSRISPFECTSLPYFLAQFVTLTIGVLKSLVERGRSPLEPAKEHPSTPPPLASAVQSWEVTRNWRHYSFRLFGVSLLLLSSFLTSGFVSTEWHQLCWSPATHLRHDRAPGPGRFSRRVEESSGTGVRRSGGQGVTDGWLHGHSPFQNVCKRGNSVT